MADLLLLFTPLHALLLVAAFALGTVYGRHQMRQPSRLVDRQRKRQVDTVRHARKLMRLRGAV